MDSQTNYPVVPVVLTQLSEGFHGSSGDESPLSYVPVKVPPEYRDLHEVFSKERASCLPPHRPYNCAIDLLSGASPPRGRVYPLSQAEKRAMEDYIQEAFQQGYIRPSVSPASSGFFFVEKKGGAFVHVLTIGASTK